MGALPVSDHVSVEEYLTNPAYEAYAKEVVGIGEYMLLYLGLGGEGYSFSEFSCRSLVPLLFKIPGAPFQVLFVFSSSGICSGRVYGTEDYKSGQEK